MPVLVHSNGCYGNLAANGTVGPRRRMYLASQSLRQVDIITILSYTYSGACFNNGGEVSTAWPGNEARWFWKHAPTHTHSCRGTVCVCRTERRCVCVQD